MDLRQAAEMVIIRQPILDILWFSTVLLSLPAMMVVLATLETGLFA